MVELFGLLIAFIGLAFAFFSYYDKRIEDEISRKEYISELRNQSPNTLRTFYLGYLEKGLNELENWFGAPCSAKALTISTFFAIIYTISFFVISWVTGRSGKIGTIHVLPDSLHVVGRFLFVVLFFLPLMIRLRLIKIDLGFQKLLCKKIPPEIVRLVCRFWCVALFAFITTSLENSCIPLFVLFVVYSPAATIAVTFAVAVKDTGIIAGAFTCAVAFALAFAIAGTLTDIGAVAVAFAIAGASTIAGLVATVVAVVQNKFRWVYISCLFIILLLFVGLFFELGFLEINSTLVSYLFFLIILPFINGFFDFVSFGISRFLGKKMLKDRTLKAFLWHFAFDFSLAVVFLSLLVFGISFGLELFNTLIVKTPDLMIDSPNLIEHARKDPFGPDSFWVTLMLFSTLVPTFAHLVITFLGVYTICITPRNWKQKIADTLEENRSKRSLTLPTLYYTSRPLLGLLFALAFWFLAVYVVNNNTVYLADILSKIAYWGIELAGKV